MPGAVGAQPGTESPVGCQGDFLEEAVFTLGLGRWVGLADRELDGTGPGASKAHPAEGFIWLLEQLLNPDPRLEQGRKRGAWPPLRASLPLEQWRLPASPCGKRRRAFWRLLLGPRWGPGSSQLLSSRPCVPTPGSLLRMGTFLRLGPAGGP